MRMMFDACLPEGWTALAVDSIFMMPHLGVLSTFHPEAAKEVFTRDCLIWLGSCIAPVGPGTAGEDCILVKLDIPGGTKKEVTCRYGDLKVIPAERVEGQPIRATISPARRCDVGAGKGKPREVELTGGVVGIVIDCRGRRPFELPAATAARVAALAQWCNAMDEYPGDSAAQKTVRE